MGVNISLIPIPTRIQALIKEREALSEYPIEILSKVIQDVGFKCDYCASCCTRAFNGHVFLLDRDVEVVKDIDSAALEPAPDPEFCDKNGIFYVSGYALRSKGDPSGSCWFLEDGRCRVYNQRFSICRIYPYMLHSEPDENGKMDWRQISGLNEHGEYHHPIPWDECVNLAKATKEYEEAFLTQQISFLEYIQEFFKSRGLKHVQKVYDEQMRKFSKGESIRVRVFNDGELEI